MTARGGTRDLWAWDLWSWCKTSGSRTFEDGSLGIAVRAREISFMKLAVGQLEENVFTVWLPRAMP